jgi:NRPS condensation-like uncharacterized protein
VTSPTVTKAAAAIGVASELPTPRQRQRFAAADELTCYYDRPAEPANVHAEVRVPGRLDEAELRAAVAAVLAAEPRLTARRAAASRWQSSYYWEWPNAGQIQPVSVSACADAAELDRLRAAFLSRSPSLDRSPALHFLLASAPDGDRLILNAHHAGLDGLACLRLIGEVARRFGERQASTSVDVAGASADPAAAAGTLAEEPGSPPQGPPAVAMRRLRSGVPLAATRIARQPAAGAGRAAPGYGACLIAWEGLPMLAERLRELGCSVNDLLITTLVVAIARWNEEHGARSGAIRITMPIGDRSQAGPGGIWANRSRLSVVSVRPPADPGITPLLSDVAAQTGLVKDIAGPQVDALSRILTAIPVPAAAKGLLLRAALRVAGSWACDTSLVSNLGVADPIQFGTLAVDEVWFSTSAHMPRGLSLGAVTLGTRLQLTFRYRHALFSDAAASQFASSYARLLDHFAWQETATC